MKRCFPYKGMELGAVVLIVIRAVHGSMSHGDDPRAHCPVLWPVGFLGQDPSMSHIDIRKKPYMLGERPVNRVKLM